MAAGTQRVFTDRDLHGEVATLICHGLVHRPALVVDRSDQHAGNGIAIAVHDGARHWFGLSADRGICRIDHRRDRGVASKHPVALVANFAWLEVDDASQPMQLAGRGQDRPEHVVVPDQRDDRAGDAKVATADRQVGLELRIWVRYVCEARSGTAETEKWQGLCAQIVLAEARVTEPAC